MASAVAVARPTKTVRVSVNLPIGPVGVTVAAPIAVAVGDGVVVGIGLLVRVAVGTTFAGGIPDA